MAPSESETPPPWWGMDSINTPQLIDSQITFRGGPHGGIWDKEMYIRILYRAFRRHSPLVGERYRKYIQNK